MIKCKFASQSDCGKECCCFSCEEKETCSNVCVECNTDPLRECNAAFTDENSLNIFQESQVTVIEKIVNIVTQKKELEVQEKLLKEKLQEAMEQYSIKSFKNESLSITYVAATSATSIDSKKLKEDLPDIAKKYSKVSDKKAYVKVVVK